MTRLSKKMSGMCFKKVSVDITCIQAKKAREPRGHRHKGGRKGVCCRWAGAGTREHTPPTTNL